ncbi:Cytochrome c oxidase assembly protein COX19 [Teratosphaeria destructans]|uniref:Cytochrome c oxidase assembly protein COX19 n=1 Tax=Teratosphaeria destructans TaxID=418781 RepID=A0A9W7W1U6_9PEZI|nr:Cytochrome c oxidase assembly protein COX19 [Teratosphaeria destructans]
MSTFGGPGGRQIISKPIPPERGSFPLDHDAECQPIMKQYLRCLRSQRGTPSEECRELSKAYLQCRMDR